MVGEFFIQATQIFFQRGGNTAAIMQTLPAMLICIMTYSCCTDWVGGKASVKLLGMFLRCLVAFLRFIRSLTERLASSHSHEV